MADREKVIKGLTACRKTFCESCPYNATDVKNSNPICLINEMLSDALDLLKEQEAELCDRCGRRRTKSNRVDGEARTSCNDDYCELNL
jgi:hypothetical protein